MKSKAMAGGGGITFVFILVVVPLTHVIDIIVKNKCFSLNMSFWCDPHILISHKNKHQCYILLIHFLRTIELFVFFKKHFEKYLQVDTSCNH